MWLQEKYDLFFLKKNVNGVLITSFTTGNTYNIPVCLWLLETHPYNPPMVFVKPTATMQIKQSNSVDSNGKVFLPYLYEWRHVRDWVKMIFSIKVIIIINFCENKLIQER